MKNLNKVFAMLLVVAMMMTSVVFADFTDVADDAAYAEAIEVGVALGLFTGYEDGTFQPEGNITRAEFAAMVVRALNQENQAKSAATAAPAFSDVAADHWANGYINIASKKGIINGYPDGTFRPENNVTFEEAVKMLVVAIGHEPEVGTAGYPIGYLTVADDYDITNGDAMGVVGEAATRGLVAQLLLNTMDTPLMKQTGYGAFLDYKVYDGYNDTNRETLLSENHGIIKLKVVVESTSLLASASTNDEEYVTVEILDAYDSKYEDDLGTKIFAGETEISELVGKKAIVYAAFNPKTDDDPTAVYAKVDTSKTYELTVSSADREAVVCGDACTGTAHDHADADITFYYYKTATDKKATDITVSKDATVYVNGVLTCDSSDAAEDIIEKLEGYYGEATFQINTAGSDVYDTIFITNYETLVVESVSTKRARVTSKNGATSVTYYDEDGAIDATLVDAAGVEMAWEDLKENDIISVVRSVGAGKTVIKAELLTATVTGKVTGVSSDNTEYVIAGDTYAIDGDNVTADDIALGDEGTFYLDVMGNICYIDTTADLNTNYAIVVEAKVTGSLDTKTALKLFTYDGQFGWMETATKVKLDGIANIVSAELAAVEASDDEIIELESAKTAAESAKLAAQYGADKYVMDDDEIIAVKEIAANNVITFKTNAAGEITEIARANTSDFSADISGANKGIFAQYAADVDLTYNEKSETFDGATHRLSITDKTVIMVAPAGASEEDDFSLFSAANIVDELELKDADIYNVNEDKEVGFILVKAEVETVDAGAIMALVTGTASTSDDEGNTVWNIKVLQDGLVKDGADEDALVTAADNNFGLAVSYAIVPKYNAAGEVKAVDTLAYFDGTDVTFAVTNPEDDGGEDDDIYYYYGKLTDRTKKNFTIAALDGQVSDETYFSVAGDTNVYVYNKKVNAKYASTIETYDIVEFEDGQAYVGDTAVNAAVIAREVEGEIIDLIIYIY